MKKLIFAYLVFTILSNTSLYSQQACTDTNAIYTFEYDGKNYAIVKDSMTWNDAVNCSNELGGTLAHIDSQAEQNALWVEFTFSSSLFLCIRRCMFVLVLLKVHLFHTDKLAWEVRCL